MTELTEKEFGAHMIADMTDGSTESYASINADNKRLELLYNLCQNGRVYGYSLKPYDKSYIKGLKIYASDDLGIRFGKESALVYENKTENETGTEFEKPITARYIRVSCSRQQWQIYRCRGNCYKRYERSTVQKA